MLLTVAIYRQNNEQFLQLEVGGDMTMADLKGLIEAETGITAAQIDVFIRSAIVSDNSQTLRAGGLSDGDIIEVRVRKAGQQAGARAGGSAQAGSSLSAAAAAAAGSSRQGQQQAPEWAAQAQAAAERLRMQALENPQFLAQMRNQAPDMAEAVNDSSRFAEQYIGLVRKQQEAEAEQQRMYARLEDDPFDVEAQRKIEEIIREQQVMKNYEDAVENLPESFAQVTMLYIPVEVNGHPLKAFVDSGAQTTIMSPGCAERCGILRLLDKRFGGIARGVGTAKILGRVHSAQMKVGNVHLACSFTVMEGKDVDLLFGLDMLKRHQGVIDLKQNALLIQGETIPFLPDSEIPKKDFAADEPLVDGPAGLKTGARSGTVVQPDQQPGASGQTTGGAGAGAGASSSAAQRPSAATAAGGGASSSSSSSAAQEFPKAHIDQLIALGFTPEEALNALRATNGDLDQAAAMLFG